MMEKERQLVNFQPFQENFRISSYYDAGLPTGTVKEEEEEEEKPWALHHQGLLENEASPSAASAWSSTLKSAPSLWTEQGEGTSILEQEGMRANKASTPSCGFPKVMIKMEEDEVRIHPAQESRNQEGRAVVKIEAGEWRHHPAQEGEAVGPSCSGSFITRPQWSPRTEQRSEASILKEKIGAASKVSESDSVAPLRSKRDLSSVDSAAWKKSCHATWHLGESSPCVGKKIGNLEDMEQSPIGLKKRHMTSFQEEWKHNEDFKEWILKVDDTTAQCRYCGTKFTVKYDGVRAVRRHLESESHAKHTGMLLCNSVSPKTPGLEVPSVAAVEVGSLYHAVMHQHSYLSTDCGMKLSSVMFEDSVVAKKMHCGRTKAKCIIENILGPKSVEDVVQALGGRSTEKIPFSIAMDASSRGSHKTFPVAVRYFDAELGVQEKLLDFYELSSETAVVISDSLLRTLRNLGLSIANIVAYMSSNEPINGGARNSVFQILKAKKCSLIRANCYCQVLHNAARHACLKISYDVEILVQKVYAEFSRSNLRKNKLKECFEELGMYLNTLFNQGNTSWLSLFPAVEQLILSWPAIKLYFLELGEEQTSNTIWQFVGGHVADIGHGATSKISLPECYLYFVHHFMKIFHGCVALLETKHAVIPQLHTMMCNLRQKLADHRDNQFFGGKLSLCLKQLPDPQVVHFKGEATKVYNRAIAYLEKCYDFNNSTLKEFIAFDLDRPSEQLTLEHVCKAAKILDLEVNVDSLRDELNLMQTFLPEIRKMDLPLDEKWVKLLKHIKSKSLVPVVSAVIAIPISNAYTQKVLSHVGSTWRGDRNRMLAPLVKAELCIKFNYEMTCVQFFKYIKKQPQLLRACISSSKYKF